MAEEQPWLELAHLRVIQNVLARVKAAPRQSETNVVSGKVKGLVLEDKQESGSCALDLEHHWKTHYERALRNRRREAKKKMLQLRRSGQESCSLKSRVFIVPSTEGEIKERMFHLETRSKSMKLAREKLSKLPITNTGVKVEASVLRQQEDGGKTLNAPPSRPVSTWVSSLHVSSVTRVRFPTSLKWANTSNIGCAQFILGASAGADTRRTATNLLKFGGSGRAVYEAVSRGVPKERLEVKREGNDSLSLLGTLNSVPRHEEHLRLDIDETLMEEYLWRTHESDPEQPTNVVRCLSTVLTSQSYPLDFHCGVVEIPGEGEFAFQHMSIKGYCNKAA